MRLRDTLEEQSVSRADMQSSRVTPDTVRVRAHAIGRVLLCCRVSVLLLAQILKI